MSRFFIIILLATQSPNGVAEQLSTGLGLSFTTMEETLSNRLYNQIIGEQTDESNNTKNLKSDQFNGGDLDYTSERRYARALIPVSSFNVGTHKLEVVTEFTQSFIKHVFRNGVGKFLDPLDLKLKQRSISIGVSSLNKLFENQTISLSNILSISAQYSENKITAESNLIFARLKTHQLYPIASTKLRISSLQIPKIFFDIEASTKDFTTFDSLGVTANIALTLF